MPTTTFAMSARVYEGLVIFSPEGWPCGVITKARYSEPDGFGGWLLDLWVEEPDGSIRLTHNVHTRFVEEALKEAS